MSAHHWLPDGQRWTVYGHYIARIADRRIAELKLETFAAGEHDGLPTVAPRRPSPARATEKAMTQTPRRSSLRPEGARSR